MPSIQSIDEVADLLRAENKLDDNKYQAVKLALKKQLNLWLILLAIGVAMALYSKHYTLWTIVRLVIFLIAGPLYLIQQRKIYARTAYLYNFGFIKSCKIVKIIPAHPGFYTHWKVVGEYLSKSGATVACKFTVSKKSNPAVAAGDELKILCGSDAQDSPDVVYFDNIAKANFDMRRS